MISDLDDIIPFSKRHKGETIRQIIRYDSGYLKDLFLNDSRLCFTEECFAEICRLTKGHSDNWENPSPQKETTSIFSKLKPYATPYLYDFNFGDLESINNNRIKL